MAFYEANTLKAQESVLKDLVKRGCYTQNEWTRDAAMSYEQLIQLAQRCKKKQTITPDTPRKITDFEVLDKIATAKVEGKWLIMNVLWQDYHKNN